jgi:hypothetical protein
MWLLVLILLVLWAGGSYVPSSPVRGNSLLHLILVVVVILVLYELLVGGGLPRLGRWH